jgi:hypothetical protein
MKWFGEPWPSAELRASVCEDDKDHVPLPANEKCAMCGNVLEPDAQGVVIPHMEASDIMPGMFITEIRYIHIDCMMRSILGE